jgi:hypothetical protein
MRSDGAGARNFGLTKDGHFYGWSRVKDAGSNLLLFDVAAGTLTSMGAPQSAGWLMGADGDDLVFRVPGAEGQTTARWFNQPTTVQ